MCKLLIVIMSLIVLVLPAAASAQEPTALATLESFKESGVPIGAVVAYDETTDPNRLLGRPGAYVEKVAWHDERIEQTMFWDGTVGVDTGGSIERFATTGDLERRHQSLSALDGTVFGREYRYVVDRMLLRLPFALTPSQAAEYATLFGAA